MPISDYPEESHLERETYVAYLDISGFKAMMQRGLEAKVTLNRFYNTIHDIQSDFQATRYRRDLLEVDAIVVSDCAILFSRNRNSSEDRVKGLRSLLTFIQRVNHDLICAHAPGQDHHPPITTTCSIAYGKFEYKGRFEIKGIEKEFFVGWAYVKAFQDNEYSPTRIRPGQCRLLKTNTSFPKKPRRPEGSVFSVLKGGQKYYHFYWMLRNLAQVKDFSREYKEAFKLRGQARYSRVEEILQNYACSESDNPWNL